MNEFKGTPGPWFTGESRRDLINIKHFSNKPGAMSLNLAHVVARQSWVEEAKANAQLIAAAPELLKELQTLVACIIDLENYYDFSADVLIEDAQAIIAKALGETKMKLIELLVQELPKRGGWPDGVGRISMHADGNIYFDGNIKLPKCDDGWDSKLHPFEYTNEVTRKQYEAALAASQNAAWSGDDLPPVGCECEVRYRHGGKDWGRFKCIAVDNEVAFGWCEDEPVTLLDDNYEFRPIRSEANKKRDEAIRAMHEFTTIKNSEIIRSVKYIYDVIAAGKIPGVKLSD